MKVVSLFSGMGGIDYGLVQAGHKIILQCEVDEAAQRVLKQHFPGVQLVSDICSIGSLPKDTELVVAGFPCIDVSRAGLRAGLSGQASGLVHQVFRLLQTAKARHRPVPWVLLENVEALLDRNGDDPPAITSLVSSFEALGYSSWAHRVVASAGFGVPNRRRRVFLLASWHGDARDVLLAQGLQKCLGGCEAPGGPGGGARGPCWECFAAGDCDPSVHPDYALDLGNARSAPVPELVPTFTTCNDRICLLRGNGTAGSLRIEDAERLQGLPEGFTAPAVEGGGGNGGRGGASRDSVAFRQRFALIGNAVTVQVAKWLGDRLAAPYRYKYVMSTQDRAFRGNLASKYSTICEELSEPGGGEGLLIRPDTDDTGDNTREELQSFTEGVEAALPPGFSDFDGISPAPGAQRSRARQAGGGNGNADDDADGEEGEGPSDANDNGRRSGQGSRSVQRLGRPQPRYSWPRAAWFIRGVGRFAVYDTSEAPLKLTFSPLSSFITRMDEKPSADALSVYVQRLAEHGWLVGELLATLQRCGIRLPREVTDARGLPPQQVGCAAAPAAGALCWARQGGRQPARRSRGQAGSPANIGSNSNSSARKGVWWPSWALPASLVRSAAAGCSVGAPVLPAGEAQRLSAVARRAWQAAPAAALAAQGATGGTDDAPYLVLYLGLAAELAATQAAAQGPSADSAAAGTEGGGHFAWVARGELHDWADKSIKSEIPRRRQLQRHGVVAAWDSAWALAVAADARAGAAGLGGAAPQPASPPVAVSAARTTRAAAALAGQTGNGRQRCGSCSACTTGAGGGVPRRCLRVRLWRAYQGGHSGAQLAVLGQEALGARLDVYWPLEQQYFPGKVTEYFRSKESHTVTYNDGDVEVLQLWEPRQVVRVVSVRAAGVCRMRAPDHVPADEGTPAVASGQSRAAPPARDQHPSSPAATVHVSNGVGRNRRGRAAVAAAATAPAAAAGAAAAGGRRAKRARQEEQMTPAAVQGGHGSTSAGVGNDDDGAVFTRTRKRQRSLK